MEQSAYDILKKKYGLPDFDSLDAEFEISSVEGDSWILKNVCKKMRERLELVIDVVERILQPDTNSYANMYECKFFTGSEKDAILSLFKHVMHFYRELLEIELLNDEKSCAQFVKNFFVEWQQIKKSLLPFVEKLKLAWKESEKEKEKLEYLG